MSNARKAPAIAFGNDNQLRLFFRQPVNVNWLAVWTTSWNGTGWTKPEKLPDSDGRIDQKIVPAGTARQTMSVRPSTTPRAPMWGERARIWLTRASVGRSQSSSRSAAVSLSAYVAEAVQSRQERDRSLATLASLYGGPPPADELDAARRSLRPHDSVCVG